MRELKIAFLNIVGIELLSLQQWTELWTGFLQFIIAVISIYQLLYGRQRHLQKTISSDEKHSKTK